jgi:predicted dehydrogenase
VLAAIDKSLNVRVTALCDIDNGRLQAAAKTVDGDNPRLFSDYREMLDYRELDAVFVETPCYLHKEMIVAVLGSGRHCYGEKPMALTVPDLDAVVRAAAHSKVIFQIGTQLRYASPWKPAIAAVHSGVIGKPVLIRAHRHNAGDVPHDHTWFFYRETSGDPICEQAVHEFDIFNAIFQGIPVRASGFGGQALLFEPKGRDIMDHYTLSLDYGMSKLVSYSHSWISSPEVPKDGRQEVVYGDKGAIDIEDGMIYPKTGKPYKVDSKPGSDSTQLAVDDFFHCIRKDMKPLCGAEAGRNAALVALLGRMAIDEGRVVTMKELLATA